jgi:hypothetical protein
MENIEEGREALKKDGYEINGINGCELTHYERMAIIEYLKTPDLDNLAKQDAQGRWEDAWDKEKTKPEDIRMPVYPRRPKL